MTRRQRQARYRGKWEAKAVDSYYKLARYKQMIRGLIRRTERGQEDKPIKD